MILVATGGDMIHPTPSLFLLLEALRARGFEADHRSWTDGDFAMFGNAEIVLPLCCWEYQAETGRFLDWVKALEATSTLVLNSAATIRWNVSKAHVLDVAAAGLPVPHSVLFERPDAETIAAEMRALDWQIAVMKPLFGENGDRVQQLRLDAVGDWWIDRYADGLILQSFESDIVEFGETTMTFIDGRFSHAVRRRLPRGEWRANLQFGAIAEAVDPSEELIRAARRYIDCAPETPLYARVDGIAGTNGFKLIELELISPYLYLEFSPHAADRLADAIAKRLRPS